MKPRLVALALLVLPTVILSGWAFDVARRQTEQASLRIAVAGYDPRDLLRGHYVNFTLNLTYPNGTAECVCLEPAPDETARHDPARPERLRPVARPTQCEAPGRRAACRYYLRNPQQTFRYYADQQRAKELEKLLANRAVAAVTTHFDGEGGVSFSAMTVDDAKTTP